MNARFALAGERGSLVGERGSLARRRATVLILVLWISFGLASLALLFGHSMMLEYRASDNATAKLQAAQAIEGARAYSEFVLTQLTTPGTMPDTTTYESEQAAVGDAYFWFLGRGDDNNESDTPVYGLVDEASKLNINTATQDMLEAVPGMTPELAAAIIDWRDEDENITDGGAESQDYLLREPAYNCKNAKFETLEELRLVMGADMQVLYGEDANFNGALDPNEDDGAVTPPDDSQDGRLDFGVIEYLTVYSKEPNKTSDGSDRTNVNNSSAIRGLLTNAFKQKRADEIRTALQKSGSGQLRSVLEFYIRGGLKPDEFSQIEDSLTVTDGATIEGRVNINTASADVLACIPGIGQDFAGAMVAYRIQNPDSLDSITWVRQVVDDDKKAIEAGPYITVKTYQISADVAAVGHNGRGLRRTRFVFDLTGSEPTIVYRRDETRLGWPLGAATRENLISGEQAPQVQG